MKNLFLGIVSVVCFIISVLSCTSQQEKEFRKIENYFENKHGYKVADNINKVIIIGEGSNCSVCDKVFAQTAREYLADSSVFLITAKGSIVDIEPFRNLKQNCFFDWQSNLSDLSLNKSRIIYFSNNKIDTVIVINSNEFMAQMEFIQSIASRNNI
ncbi:MAG: hypothetical protein LBV41_02115 [Cytophagaceae bacterium]|jgi:hypothetical protein|nr:hypothetical protein [Cytophagaceae bacterium]